MAVLQMQRIHICALKSNRKQILEELQRSGTVQIEREEQEDDVFQRTDTAAVRTSYEKRAQNAQTALNVLDEYAPEKKGMFSSLEGRKKISVKEYYAEVENNDEAVHNINLILKLSRYITEDRAGQVRAETNLEALKPWMSLDVPMDFDGTRTVAAFIGALPGEWTLEQIQSEIARTAPDLDAFSVEVIGADRDQTCIFAVCGRADQGRMEETLRSIGFLKPTIQTSKVPEEYARELTAARDDYVRKADEAAARLNDLASERDAIRFTADYYTMRAQKYEVLGELLQSRHVFFVNGYIPENAAGALKEKLESEYSCQVELEDIPEDEEAPVLLHNSAFASPTESVVSSYGLPHKGEIDPTTIMACFYYVLFGMMLSDAGYGALMVLGCGFALKKFPDMSEGMHKTLTMFLYCGISTFIWGCLFGGFFGDAITVIGETFFGVSIAFPTLWFTPLDNPMRLLMYSFLIGIIHLFVGLGIKGYQQLRQGEVMDFLGSVVMWYLLLVGLILMLLPTDIFASMWGSSIVIPGWLKTLSYVMAVVGAAGIVLNGVRGNKNVIVGAALGAYDLYGITSWLSDILSYSRLLALGLATGVIAQVVNTMGAMFGGGIIGAIGFTAVFLIGHALNMAINLLGAYVHTNRLQYVEFFGKFYDGGGKAFEPFTAASTKYINIKEEN